MDQKKTAYLGLFAAIAIIFGYVESLIPFFAGIPGMKLGLANLAVLFVLALLLDGLIDRMEAELGRKATVVATGGIAPVIAPACRHEMHMAADLILRGLAVLYEQNK